MTAATGHGSRIVWNLGTVYRNNSIHSYYPSSKEDLISVFSLRCEKTLEERVSRFAILDQNATSVLKRGQEFKKKLFFPAVTEELKATSGSNNYVFVTGRTKRFKFITTHRVQYLRTEITYAAPFQIITWTGLFSMLGITAGSLGVAFKMLEKKSVVKSTLMSFFWVSVILIEQCDSETPARTRNGTVKTMCRIIFGFWIMMGIIITNGYKGIIKSNMLVNNPFSTDWKRIEELENFILYVPFSDSRVCQESVIEDPIPDTKTYKVRVKGTFGWKSFGTRPEPLFSYGDLLHVCEGVNIAIEKCRFQLELDLQKKSLSKYFGMKIPEWEKQTESVEGTSVDQEKQELMLKLQGILNHTVYFCENYLERVLVPKLKDGRKALIVEEDKLEFFMRRLRISDASMKWGSNKDEPDDFLTMPKKWMVTDWDGPLYQRVPKRMRTLMTSGIFWLWERWEQANFYRRKYLKEESFVRPLSFSGNDIYLVFQFLGAFWTFDAIALILEICLCYRRDVLTYLTTLGRIITRMIVVAVFLLRGFVQRICRSIQTVCQVKFTSWIGEFLGLLSKIY
ncbi:unnamed protein product [Allacma fusca]|uniref:Uncharacterized protein n=1 Tax=Allacma fusca TaxID=39272 RepID=A0A8J2KNX0_9HEXA|nr:unnamed protein product [Allacma fusca]